MIDLDYKILKILRRNDGKAKIKEIKKKIDAENNSDIRHSTIDSSILRLEKQGHVEWEKYKPISLTENGRNLANELIRHTQLLEVLFHKAIGLSKEEAKAESEKLNLLLSCDTIEKICETYGHPTECPCGEPILNSSNCHCHQDR